MMIAPQPSGHVQTEDTMTRRELDEHFCNPRESWVEHDAQGIYLSRVCGACVDARLATYRPEILTGYSQADVDEAIEPDGEVW